MVVPIAERVGHSLKDAVRLYEAETGILLWKGIDEQSDLVFQKNAP